MTDTKEKPAEGDKPANIGAATKFDPSGAPVQLVPDVDPDHPAVDADPRKGTSVDQNRIDFNDPTLNGAELAEKAADAAAKTSKADD